ncbi:radical SAM/CxCxxxxC motif protein YfkAB [Fictibacillus terranigra]|uniref:Radical SAM/CxCxxxxC motif protein YfkAB n=1 Tax=Fictibacillus terranigra TaxID=3058424 RepID=A0ABT8EBI3_9BACL|nr:radical SAM/CxCxxxxC motif protein YfkAB [Fictibacillus sp. CENA-BCM004]MDN4075222.1 radical SAM/CxCxxxxC motif protein YfkAB [Fictibacillus sp. CENA-BCM004]
MMVKQPISVQYDPWEAYMDMEQYGAMKLTNIEVTTTTLCNMRCAHCAVGYTLNVKDPEPLPLELLIRRLDEIPDLRAFSITGGEPMMSKKSVDQYVVPLLQYASARGARTQINSNLTLDLNRYEPILPYLDVLHISHNWGTPEDFAEIGFAVMERKPSMEQRTALFDRMVHNARELTKRGVIVSAETMLNKTTLPYLEKIHEHIQQMGCQRHEIHPMYPSDFASSLQVLSLAETRTAIHRLLDVRNEDVWMLFGTLPFYACSASLEDQELLKRLYAEKNVTVRNDPDGRSRLNVNLFDGDIIVTDFGDTPSLGNIKDTTFLEAYNKWNRTETAKSLSCHCPAVKCLGPNLLVKDTYYKDWDFPLLSSKI